MKIAIIGEGKGAELIDRHFKEMLDPYEGKVEWSFFDELKGKPLTEIPEDHKLIISSSNMQFRRRIFAQYPRDRFINVNRSDDGMQQMGFGNLISPNVHFDYFAEIGDNNVISNGTIINHHCKVGSGNLFGTGCMLNGSVTIGDNCTIGAGVIFEPKVRIGNDCVIVSGSVICGDLPTRAKVLVNKTLEYGPIYQGNRIIR